MNKRDFLKTTGMAITSSMLPSIANAQSADPRTNWAGNLTYHTAHLDQATSRDEVVSLVKSKSSVKALGSRHSFNTIADTTGDQVSLKQMQNISIDAAAKTVTVDAGIAYGQLAPYLDQHGYALHNLASLPHISVAGAINTATHGSGTRNGNLSTAVAGLEFVKADGSIVTLTRNDGESFNAAVVGLGSLGILTRVTLDIQPTFQMTQILYQNMSMNELEHNLETIMSSGYSVSLFTNWQNHQIQQVWIKNKYQQGHQFAPMFYGATKQTQKLHPLPGHDATPCTEQMGIPGPWYERMPHFRMNFTPSSGQELQTEYFVPRDKAYQAILAVETLKDHITPHLFVTELRAIKADNLWLSMAYQRDSLALHFTWKPEWPEVKKVLPMIEAKLEPFGGRPHWGKLFTTNPAKLKTLYPKFADFQNMRKTWDPQGKFVNDFLKTNLVNA